MDVVEHQVRVTKLKMDTIYQNEKLGGKQQQQQQQQQQQKRLFKKTNRDLE
jgi:hypothetical protein